MTPDAQHEGDAAFSKLTEYCWKNCPVDGPHEAGCYDIREIAVRAALRERDARWAAAVKASGLMLSPDSDNEAWQSLRALLEEAGK